MQKINGIWRPVVLAGLFAVLAACGQDHDGDHGHAHEGDAAHAHDGEHAHDSAPETEAFYPGDDEASTDTASDEPASDATDSEETMEASPQTDDHGHAHGDDGHHAH
ncbi:MAG: hypothetical protein V7688_01650 [Alcanivorax jadensis]|uniref:hypothetical protein n=1 Tax=Alcanivorax jadensis TaxID=64988 RepID=UPI0030037E9B